MATAYTTCPRCHHPVPAGAQYCPNCGEPVDPALVGRLREMFDLLRTLDERIAGGWGERTVADLRRDTLGRYLSMRSAVATATVPSAATAPAAPDAALLPDTPTSAREPAAALAASMPAAQAARPAPAVPAAPAAPVFSWRAFVAEQAIAIMAYLGGFLLLVATLAFEVGGWQDLANGVKLAAVVAVYVVFGALGFALRRSAHLRTVGRAYLGVFALMTPLVALAVYRFELQALGFPVAGMVCVTAAYAAAIYLILGQRTGFLAYGYLGWASLALAALAIVPWASAAGEWYVVALAAVSCVLIATERLTARRLVATVTAPALHLAAATSIAAAFGTLQVGAQAWDAVRFSDAVVMPGTVAAFALSAAGVALAGFMWEWATLGGAMGLPADVADPLDALATGYAVLAGIGVVAWAGAGERGVSYVLAALALVIGARAALLRRMAADRTGLRYTLEAMATVTAAVGAWLVIGDPAPNTPLLAALSAGLIVTLAAALLEDTPWVALAAGLFLSLDYHTLVVAGAVWTGADKRLVDDMRAAAQAMSNFTLALIAVLWLAGLGLGFRRDRARRYAWPLLLTALGNALYCVPVMGLLPVAYAAPAWALLAAAALVAGWRERQPIWTGVVVSCFGILASLVTAAGTSDVVPLFALGLVPAVAALTTRRWLGRDYAYGPYLVALWATAEAAAAMEGAWQPFAGVVPLGMHLAVWLLLAVAVVGIAAALMEGIAWTMSVPALLALVALTLNRPGLPLTSILLTVLFAGIGVTLRQYRGRWWSVPWHGAAALGALLATERVGTLDHGPVLQVALLLGFAALAYLVALHEQQPWATAATTVYALLAVAVIPGPDRLVPTLAITFGAALLGGGLRLRLGRPWALAFYAAAAGASIAAIARISPYDAGTTEALLLLFAALAYGLALLERQGQPQATAAIAPVLYAGAAAIAQPDAHALLPLALTLGVAGLAVSRLSGPRWAWPFYASAAVAAVLTSALGVREPGFEAAALLALALVTYAAAAVESRPEALIPALLLGGLALASEIGATQASAGVAALAFAALAWLYYAGAELWQRIPWLRAPGVWERIAWWADPLQDRERAVRISEPRATGIWIHRASGLAVAAGTPLGAALAGNGLAPHTPEAQAGALALLSLAALLLVHEHMTGSRIWRYVAGALAALAVSWEARWLGATNIQAFVLAPGSYLIVAGSLMPGDERLRRLRGLGRQCTLAGALALLLPSLLQSFVGESTWVYALLLALEALALAGYGVGSRSRVLVLIGSLFVGIAALRGAALAVNSGVPVALVIGLLALLLMGLATWLSLRARREAGTT
jgi:hypothetical protein